MSCHHLYMMLPYGLGSASLPLQCLETWRDVWRWLGSQCYLCILPDGFADKFPFKWSVATGTLNAPPVKTVLSCELGTAALNLHRELNGSLICCGSFEVSSCVDVEVVF